MKLLSVENDPKTRKGSKRGVLTAVLYMAPAMEAGVGNLCGYSTQGCRAGCLYFAGRGGMAPIQEARIRKAQAWKSDRAGFLAQLAREIGAHEKRARSRRMIPAVRLNGTTDLPWERFPVTVDGTLYCSIMDAFPRVRFYDYTKWPLRKRGVLPTNYHLTYSLNDHEESEQRAAEYLHAGYNVAAVYATPSRRGERLPKWQSIGGESVPVVDGDVDDIRFLDPAGSVAGLRWKGSTASMDVAARDGFALSV